ncbi:hypothetical protein D6821_02125 [Candidatus Parcubacteria bacterium]|nr:MAG: hypothetical protein D6821_02125 [Candidatus Parcubacteria bacterium]
MGKFLTLNYWFNLRPGMMVPTAFKIFILFLVVLATAALINGIIRRWMIEGGPYKKLSQRLGSFLSTQLVIGLVLLFFVYEEVPFLSARFWFLLWGASMLVWLFFIIKFACRIPELITEQKKKEEFEKYLPSNKK